VAKIHQVVPTHTPSSSDGHRSRMCPDTPPGVSGLQTSPSGANALSHVVHRARDCSYRCEGPVSVKAFRPGHAIETREMPF